MRQDIGKLIEHWSKGYVKGDVKQDAIVQGLASLPSNVAVYAAICVYKRLQETDGAYSSNLLNCLIDAAQASQQRISNVFGHINDQRLRVQALERDIGDYYYWDSRCFKAIKKHIETAKDCVLIDRLDLPFKPSKAHSPIKYVSSTSWSDLDGHREVTDFRLDIEVQYVEDRDDCYSPKEITKKYEIYVPIELENDCTDKVFKERFEKFLSAAKKKRDQQLKDEILPEVEALVKKHPEMAKRILATMKKK